MGGQLVGSVSWNDAGLVGVFQYDPDFAAAGIEPSPFEMPLRTEPYSFGNLHRGSFHGLPGLLADALPDDFGNALIDAWLQETGRDPVAFSPVDRLCYIGSRGMGALEFEPAIPRPGGNTAVELAELVDLANRVLTSRAGLHGRLETADDRAALEDILAVGTSAGGARAKAVLAFNPETGEFRSGQVDTQEGFEHWILKFDGVHEKGNLELASPQGYGKIEYAYHLMARAAGIRMTECRLHHEGGRSHFMTRRFDRDPEGRKLHMQSLGGLRHFAFQYPPAYSYEEAMHTIRALGLDMDTLQEQFRRAIFNVVARNQDDHVKNLSFLMDGYGQWRLSPAYDVTYAYNPKGWTRAHQLSLGGKRDGFERKDLLRFADVTGVPRTAAVRMIDEVISVVSRWPKFAAQAEVSQKNAEKVGTVHRAEDLRIKRATVTADLAHDEEERQSFSTTNASPAPN